MLEERQKARRAREDERETRRAALEVRSERDERDEREQWSIEHEHGGLWWRYSILLEDVISSVYDEIKLTIGCRRGCA